MNKNKHLTIHNRLDIQQDLANSLSFKVIGAHLDKDCTTIYKEVKSHILFFKRGASYRPFNDCPHRMHCYHYGDICGKCSRKTKTKCSSCASCLNHCPDYKKEECTLLKKLPYVCNGCGIKHMCTLETHLYDAHTVRPERIRSNKNGVLFWLYLALILRKKSLHSLILCSVLFLKTDSLFTAS